MPERRAHGLAKVPGLVSRGFVGLQTLSLIARETPKHKPEAAVLGQKAGPGEGETETEREREQEMSR